MNIFYVLSADLCDVRLHSEVYPLLPRKITVMNKIPKGAMKLIKKNSHVNLDNDKGQNDKDFLRLIVGKGFNVTRIFFLK